MTDSKTAEAPSEDKRESRSRLWKALRFFVFALIGLEIVYLIAANFFLNSELGISWVNRRPEKWDITWDGGWTIIPGHIHMDRPDFDRYGRRDTTHAEAEKIRFKVDLFPLASRRVVAHDVAIRGLQLAIRREPKDDTEAGTLPGSAPGTAQRRKPGWHIELSDIAIDGIESFTLNDFRVAGGQARLTGAFETQVRAEISAPRAVLSWRDATLRKGDQVIAEPLQLNFEGGFSSFNPREERGFAIIDHLSGKVGVEGTVSRLSILRHFFAGVQWIQTLDGRGELKADLLLEEGALQPGSELIADADDLLLDFLGYSTEGNGQIHGTVSDTSGQPDQAGPVRMEVLFDDFIVRRKPSTVPSVQGQGFRLVATTSDPDLRYGLSDLDVVLDMPHAEVPDLSIYGAYLPADLGLAIESGRGVARFYLEASAVDETVFGHFEVDGKKVAGRFQDLTFDAGLEIRTKISGGDLENFSLEIEGTRLEIKDGIFRDDRNTKEEGWWMTVDVPRGTAHLGSDTLWLEADVKLAMRDTRVIIAMFAELKSWLQRFEKILTVKDVTGSGSLVLQGRHLFLRNLEIEGRKLHGRAELDLGDEKRRGILYIRFHGISIGLERDGDEKDWKLTGVKKWFDRRVTESW